MSDQLGPWTPPFNIAHRGASARAPENTVAAFERAIRDGATAVEMDLRTTVDGRVVVIHDRTVDRTTNGAGAVAALDYDAVRELDAGSWFGPDFAGVRIPSLEEVVDRILPQIPCVLHAKSSLAARAIPRLVADRLRPRVTVSCSSLTTLRQLAGTGLRRTWVAWWRDWPGWTAWVVGRAARAGVDCLAAEGVSLTHRMVAQAHDRGLQIRAWGVNDDLALARRVLARGADGMTFNDPARLAALLDSHQGPASP